MRKIFGVCLGTLLILLMTVVNSVSQNVYVNAKLWDETKCFPLDSINSISTGGTPETMVSVEISLASGVLILGGIRFSLLKQLSDFDIKKWLASEKTGNDFSISSTINSSGESNSKMKAKAGDRIVVRVNMKDKEPITFVLFTCP